ncbi:biotin/lipoate A/B protein ligase family protein [Pontiella sp.]|uniref:lipoate--protein ligase family protein n=1 Tax=Pontiella sp. TaxID=2837462 RepID=UPI0035680048
MLIVESQSMDVHRNLAIEEYLMDRVQDRGPILFLWRSECAVVMGKNQNPWRECRLDRMAADGVPLARRVSGGGTVYHDAGNLNYCVITGREEYCECDAYHMVFKALEPCGIKAEKTGLSNLSVDGLKFSGNAFAFRKGRALHHGTLLLKADMQRLGRYLGPMLSGIETHAIASVPAPVANLGLEIEATQSALRAGFMDVYGPGEAERWNESDLDAGELEALGARHLEDSWLYGATPRFSVKTDAEVLEIAKGTVLGGRYSGKAFKDVAFSFVC